MFSSNYMSTSPFIRKHSIRSDILNLKHKNNVSIPLDKSNINTSRYLQDSHLIHYTPFNSERKQKKILEVKAELLLNTSSPANSFLSPKAKSIIREIDTRKNGPPALSTTTATVDEQKKSIIDLTIINPISPYSSKIRNKFIEKAKEIHKPYYQITNPNTKCTIENKYPHSNKNRKHIEIFKDSLLKKLNNLDNWNQTHITHANGNTKAFNNKQLFVPKTKSQASHVQSRLKVHTQAQPQKPAQVHLNSHAQTENSVRIKNKIKQLKNFKFSIDLNSPPNKEKHRKTIENNLNLLTEIKTKLEKDLSNRNKDEEDQSVSIDSLNN